MKFAVHRKKTCWEILEIKPTPLEEEIKKAYRKKAKLYHPDLVSSPEKKRKYHLIFCELKDAYDDALRKSKQMNFVVEDIAAYKKPSDSFYRFADIITWILAIPFVLIWVLPYIFYVPFFPRMIFGSIARMYAHSPENLSTVVLNLITAALVAMMISGILDAVLLFLTSTAWINRFHWDQYEEKIRYGLILVGNVLLFYLTPIGDFWEGSENPYGYLINGVYRFAGAFLIPILLLGDWIKTYYSYQRVKYYRAPYPRDETGRNPD